MNEAIAKGVPVQHRSDNYDDYLRRLSQSRHPPAGGYRAD